MQAPLRFAHFEVLSRSDGSALMLGHGAMGVTYKALDQNLLSLAVIKVPAPEMQAEPSARQRFLQEAQMMARLRHPNVASVFFFGDSPSGAFYAMEFCDGPTLQDYVHERGVMSWEDTFRLAMQAAAALQALETNDLVHRDLKPSNIILASDSAGHVQLKLIDFGVAREGLPSDHAGLTGSGFIGTPAYASPEQLLEAAHIDGRSDLYALGAVMWFCLTGKPPFAGTQFQVMFDHVNTEPEWSRLPEMPGAALAVMKRLLAKFVEERPPSPAVLIADLQGMVGGTPTGLAFFRDSSKSSIPELGGYEPISEVGSDSFGKVWRARDFLTGRTVALRLLAPEFCNKSALVMRAQRLTSFLRQLEHPNLLRIWHFEQSGSDCRIATEWVDGPNLLSWLKERKTIPLIEAIPLLAGVAEAMDYAASRGVASVETAPERLQIQITGWAEMSPEQRSTLLCTPISAWPPWTPKVCPIRLSMSSQDYVLPTDTEAAKLIARITVDFVRLSHRLLTGHGKTSGDYIPSSALNAESNEFFESHFTQVKAGLSCTSLLRQLCLAEGVEAPERPTPIDADLTYTLPKIPSFKPDQSATETIADDATLQLFSPEPGAPNRLDDFEKRHAELKQEAERLETSKRLLAEQEWIAKERQAIEGARREIASKEVANAKRAAEEKDRLAELRVALEQQQALLEDKRREQQSLEQEIQQRARLDFQSLQAETQLQQSLVQNQRAAAEEALSLREAEFCKREQESLARLESLNREAVALEERVRSDSKTLRTVELESSRRHQDEKEGGQLALDEIAAEERRIAQMRTDLEERQSQWKSAQKRRLLAFMIAGAMVILFAGITAFVMKGRTVNFLKLEGAEQWEAAVKERDRAKSEERWADVIDWCVATKESFQAKPEFSEMLNRHQAEINTDAATAISALLQKGDLTPASSEDGSKLLINLGEKTKDWDLPDNRLLLFAKLRMPEASARGSGLEAIQAYMKACQADPQFATKLSGELERVLSNQREQLHAGKGEVRDELIQALQDAIAFQTDRNSSDIVRFMGESLAARASRNGNPNEGLTLLVETAEINPAWVGDLRPQAQELTGQIARLPTPSIVGLAPLLRKAGDIWHFPEAYLALAPLAIDEDARLDDYKRADAFGSMKARALVGRAIFDTGVSLNKAELIHQGLTKLQEAAAAEEPDAMLLLGEALYQGRGVPEDPKEALWLAQKAEAKGHPEAFFLAAKSHLRLAEISRDPKMFSEASALLEKAVEKNLPSSAYFLYLASFNETVKDLPRAVKALETGSTARDANCLYTLGLWNAAGQPPVPLNLTRARTLMQEAASLGNKKAETWLSKLPK